MLGLQNVSEIGFMLDCRMFGRLFYFLKCRAIAALTGARARSNPENALLGLNVDSNVPSGNMPAALLSLLLLRSALRHEGN
jgi:hypothetical protein